MGDYSDNPPARNYTKAHSGPPRDGNGARQIASLVARLLSHFWTADDPPAMREAQIGDWIEDLIQFGPDTVSRACGEWRRTQSKRPTIADIRKLCIEDRQIHRPDPEQAVLEGPSWRDAYAKSAGFSSWLEREDAIAAQQRRYRLAEEWRAQHKDWGESVGKMKHAATALGVTAREWSPEEMSASRQQLGIEE